MKIKHQMSKEETLPAISALTPFFISLMSTPVGNHRASFQALSSNACLHLHFHIFPRNFPRSNVVCELFSRPVVSQKMSPSAESDLLAPLPVWEVRIGTSRHKRGRENLGLPDWASPALPRLREDLLTGLVPCQKARILLPPAPIT